MKILKAKTPMNGHGPWAWNEVPTGGIPPRARCQAIGTAKEQQTAVELVAEIRRQEEICCANDIGARQARLDDLTRLGGGGGVNSEMLRREMSRCDHNKFLAAQARIVELRHEASKLIMPFLKRLIISLDDALNAATLEAEKRLEAEELPLSVGGVWTLHSDGVCSALWYRRIKAEKTLEALEPNGAVGCVQYFLTSEENTPFSWAA